MQKKVDHVNKEKKKVENVKGMVGKALHHESSHTKSE
ncbi:unnamed protein product [Cylicostephanus goldi]|uniref:Uncharacterized protein n=1 Tax=Cylicostephanus goldi TaxID=71465 RepID=A0A3P7Q122_CYLGO|nr:unnamed protein product [Cylicostephanus goldi]